MDLGSFFLGLFHFVGSMSLIVGAVFVAGLWLFLVGRSIVAFIFFTFWRSSNWIAKLERASAQGRAAREDLFWNSGIMPHVVRVIFSSVVLSFIYVIISVYFDLFPTQGK